MVWALENVFSEGRAPRIPENTSGLVTPKYIPGRHVLGLGWADARLPSGGAPGRGAGGDWWCWLGRHLVQHGLLHGQKGDRYIFVGCPSRGSFGVGVEAPVLLLGMVVFLVDVRVATREGIGGWAAGASVRDLI